MKLSKKNGEEDQRESIYGGWVQFGATHKGGHSSWDEGESSVRLAWYNENGKFNPHSSAELPFWGLCELAIDAAERDLLPKRYLGSLLNAVSGSMQRSFFHSVCKDVLDDLGVGLISSFMAGSLVCSLGITEGYFILPVTVDDTVTEYSQEIFEDDLKKMGRELRKFKKLLFEKIVLIFPKGGELHLPGWFFDICNDMGAVCVTPFTETPKSRIARSLSGGEESPHLDRETIKRAIISSLREAGIDLSKMYTE